MNISKREAKALIRMISQNFSAKEKGLYPMPDLLRCETAEEPAKEQAEPELPPRTSFLSRLFGKPPGIIAGLIAGFAIRFITELIKLLLTGD